MDQISEHARSSRKPVTPLSWNTSYQTHVSLSSKHLEENAKARVVTEWGSHAEAVETILARTDIALHRIAGFVNVRKDAYALVFIGSAHSSSWWMVFRPRFGHTLGLLSTILQSRSTCPDRSPWLAHTNHVPNIYGCNVRLPPFSTKCVICCLNAT